MTIKTLFKGSLGYRKDPEDGRDYNANKLLKVSDVLESASLKDFVIDILDQKRLGSCVANAGCQAVRMRQKAQDQERTPPLGSRLFGYYNARSYHGETHKDSGTYIRYFFKSLLKFGLCKESVFPYNISKYTEQPPHKAYQKSIDQIDAVSYHRIYETGDSRILSVKRAISQGYPVVFGTTVSNDFCGNNLKPINDPPSSQNWAGGHAMVLGEYDSGSFGVLNSWGNGFGDGGWCRFSYDYVIWDYTSDLWVVEIAPKI